MGVGDLPHAEERSSSEAGLNTNVGDEGGFAPNLKSAEAALDFVMQAIAKAGYKPGGDVMLALDPAASEFFKNGKYVYAGEGKTRSPQGAGGISRRLAGKYPIVSIEDGMAEDDCEGWKILTDLIGKKCQLVGDDIFVTNVTRLAHGIKEGIANSILVKVNQIGTLTETLAAVEMAHKAGYTAVMSHRSGETEDSTIADLAVATNCGQIKTGSLARSDRTAKYNQLLRIEEELGPQAKFAGRAALKARVNSGRSCRSCCGGRHFRLVSPPIPENTGSPWTRPRRLRSATAAARSSASPRSSRNRSMLRARSTSRSSISNSTASFPTTSMRRSWR